MNKPDNKVLTLKARFKAVFAIALLILPAHAIPSDLPPPELFNEFPELQQVGKGSFTWFGFAVYEASLWTAGGSFKSLDAHDVIVLHIEYHRQISKNDLVEKTSNEWDRLQPADTATRGNWLRQILGIWPDVSKGDSITTCVERDIRTRFYSNQKPIGNINQPGFGPALLSIWLDERSNAQSLRQKLIKKVSKAVPLSSGAPNLGHGTTNTLSRNPAHCPIRKLT